MEPAALGMPLAVALGGAAISAGALALRAAAVAAGCPFGGASPVGAAYLALAVGGPALGAAALGLVARQSLQGRGAGSIRASPAGALAPYSLAVLGLFVAAVALSLLASTRACPAA